MIAEYLPMYPIVLNRDVELMDSLFRPAQAVGLGVLDVPCQFGTPVLPSLHCSGDQEDSTNRLPSLYVQDLCSRGIPDRSRHGGSFRVAGLRRVCWIVGGMEENIPA